MIEEKKPYLIINEEYDEIKINIKHTKPYMKLQQENQQLKEVIEEVRESKDEYVCTEEYCGEVGIKTTQFIEKLGQILDKAKENK
jgi:meiotically up-regulated gene 157 (Mug157) protein